jgi:FkbH-like protein
MTLLEALSVTKTRDLTSAAGLRVLLATGFTQLPLETLLKAHLCLRIPDKRIAVEGGVFDDLAGNLERAGAVDLVAVVLEWGDLDPRLGVRTLGGWTVEAIPDILRSAQLQIARIAAALERIKAPVAVSLPSLPFPPVAFSSTRHTSRLEAKLRASLLEFTAEAGSGVRVMNPYDLDRISPAGERFDLHGAITTGFPYSTKHTDAVATLLAGLLTHRPPKKGLITDLDDTLWAGILGEAGVVGIAWDLDGKAQIHGLYQQFLTSLASAGVLIGVASKNDQERVTRAFAERADLLLPAERVFPVEANWGPKSKSVANILRHWNIAARDVIFVDDSAIEGAEVQESHPDMECIVFPKNNPKEFWDLLDRLRETFGKNRVSAEDELRLQSLRAATVFLDEANNGSASEQFLSSLQAEISVEHEPDARVFELINKTNQFNLNGVRLSESEWSALISRSGTVVLKVGYRDRFGPLGTIAAVVAKLGDRKMQVEHWVMSCRAFSRRIEHQTLKLLFDEFDVEQIQLAYIPTASNGPLREFLASLIGSAPDGMVSIGREQFDERCPTLFHSCQRSN